ncbi:SprT family protein [Lentilactobacillus curieae]|uniref:SprT family protein n=1 Tax=Lentilactobacillus curieae TaxID=1138822 RepID=A0A1S6QJH9_9LACO|nr:SprT family protein [Lentilactobacillus curieae]AQW21756.1 SprT family protein [Lentilactobacillus curieae]
MIDSELQRLVEQVSLESFGKPFLHQASFNGRLKTTGGRYRLNDHNIEINRKIAEQYGQTVLVGIIKHELCHYHLHLSGHSGKHNTPEFKNLLKAVGGSRFAPPVGSPYKYGYVCEKCGLKYQRKRKIDLKKYVCGRCRGKLKLVEEIS